MVMGVDIYLYETPKVIFFYAYRWQNMFVEWIRVDGGLRESMI